MKSSERYEKIKQYREEGINQSEMARRENCTPALISQVIKKYEPKVSEVVNADPA